MTYLERLRRDFARKRANSTEAAMVKAAVSFGAIAKAVGIGSVALPAGALAVQGVEHLYWKNEANKAFPKTIKEFPVLKGFPAPVVREHFEVMRSVAPRMASMPRIAGPWLLRSLQFHQEGIPVESLRDLMGAEETMTEITPSTKSTSRNVGGFIASQLAGKQGG